MINHYLSSFPRNIHFLQPPLIFLSHASLCKPVAWVTLESRFGLLVIIPERELVFQVPTQLFPSFLTIVTC